MASSSSQASLLVLPDELLVKVISYYFAFGIHKDYISSLYATSLTNHRLYRLSMQHLYYMYSFAYGSPYLFLRTISQNQHLASQVKSICWDYINEGSDKFHVRFNVEVLKHYGLTNIPPMRHFELDGATYTKLMQMSTHVTHIAQTLHEGDCYLGAQEGLEALLTFTPDVSRVEVVETTRWDDCRYWFSPILHREPHAFSQLTPAMITGPLPLESIAALIILPSMRTLGLTQVMGRHQMDRRQFEWENEPSFDALLKQHGSNIEHLQLLESYIDLARLEGIMGAFRGLKTFTYEHLKSYRSSRLKIPINYQAMAKWLPYQRHSLESLGISPKPARSGSYYYDLETPNAVCTTLEDFPKLSHLEIAVLATAVDSGKSVFDLVPSSISNLTLLPTHAEQFLGPPWPHESIDDYPCSAINVGLEALAARVRQGKLPNLKHVVFKNWHPWYGCFPFKFAYFKAILEEIGVQLTSIPSERASLFPNPTAISCVELPTEPEWLMVEINVSQTWDLNLQAYYNQFLVPENAAAGTT